MPLVLGSLVSFLIFLAYPALITTRLKHEEALLEEELAGYQEYKKTVKYRLIPFIW
jgi:protein-S-isoprenylcysteine O-methyltransferase Ste14